MVKPVPEGYRTVTPYILVDGLEGFLGFICNAFSAEITERLPGSDGTLFHAEARIGDSLIMMGDTKGQFPQVPASLYLYVSDVDEAYRRALEAGADSIMEPEDMFYGDRSSGVRDPYGGQWWLATHVEDVSREEIVRRARESGR